MKLLEYKPVKKKKLTLRQQKYKKNRLLGMSQYNAARAAGYSESFSSQAFRVERSVKVSMKDLFEQAGVTDKFIIEYISTALEAKTIRGKDGIECEDWTARHNFMKLLLELTERLKTSVNFNSINQTTVHVHPQERIVFTSDKEEVLAYEQNKIDGSSDLHDEAGASGNRISGKI
jgi:hypothetical protein